MAMQKVTATWARSHLRELLERIESGEVVVVTRRGRPVARMAAIDKRPPKDPLAAFRATMPPARRPSAELVREMRDDERY
jgi:prevent-host-death family protein